MENITEPEILNALTPKQRKHQKELLVAMLESTGNQREYLISVLMSASIQEPGEELSLKAKRILCFSLISHLIPLLRNSKKELPTSQSLFKFCALINHLPLDDTSMAQLLFADEPEAAEEHSELLHSLELMYLLTQLGDFDNARNLLTQMEPQSDTFRPEERLIYQFAQARILQHRGKRTLFTELWLDLVCEFYQLGGSDCATFILLSWIDVLNWGREVVAKRYLLQKFGASLRTRGDIISANLLFQLFMLESKLVTPAEKMHYVKLLIKHPSDLLTVRQMQLLYFFAGNFTSGVKHSFRESIRFYQYSNYYLHKSWDYMRRLSQFLRCNLNPTQYVQAMVYLEQWVLDLGIQMSMQNNAYVETLHANYATIRDLYKQVEDLSITDNLTGLKNRRYLSNNLLQMFQLAARQNVPICFAILDIDLFKQINDLHGHFAGDQVLKDLAGILTKSFRKSDVIIRYGGDEFLLVLFNTGCTRFVRMMNDLSAEVSAHHFRFKALDLRISLSIGVHCDEQPVMTKQHLTDQIEKADAALYLAKGKGGNHVVVSGCEFPA